MLAIEHPIIKAPMAGGIDTAELIIAVNNAGGMGFIGAAYNTGEQIRAISRQIVAQTERPFGINLFPPEKQAPRPEKTALALEAVSPFYRELSLPLPQLEPCKGFDFDRQIEATLESGASVLSFTFGVMPKDVMAAARERGMLLIGSATTVAEALALEAAGVDAVVAQGSEGGGHRATFLGDPQASQIGSMALIPQVVDVLNIPVIASGGIMDGRGVAAALALGAAAAQLGTAFIPCPESGASAVYKEALLAANEDQTVVTKAFSGKPARGVRNRFIDSLEQQPEAILPFPYQNELTRGMRIAAGKAGKPEYLSLWAGQGLRSTRQLGAGELTAQLIREYRAAARRLSRYGQGDS
jgi:nitronate monooxygenase